MAASMQQRFFSRQALACWILFLYLCPVVGFLLYGRTANFLSQGMAFLGWGLFFSSLGALLFFLLLYLWETSLEARTTFVSEPFRPLEEQQESVSLEEQEKWGAKLEGLRTEYDLYREAAEGEAEQKSVLLSEYQQTITEQREVIEKKQQTVVELEDKVKDLSYEIKTLVELAERGESVLKGGEEISDKKEGKTERFALPLDREPLLDKEKEVKEQLSRSVDIAQKMTGASHFGQENSLFREVHMDSYALDLRRLFDRLQSENSHVVLVYSKREDRVLCVTPLLKELLGWNPERFAQNFYTYVEEGAEEWRNAVRKLSTTQEAMVQLLIRQKDGQERLVYCQMGNIRTGIFRGHIIAILYS